MPDRFALEVDDVADSFKKAPRTSFKTAEIMSFPFVAAYKIDREIISGKNNGYLYASVISIIEDYFFISFFIYFY